MRLHATPHAIAAGFAAGVFASFTPLLGFHFLVAFALAYCVAGNMAAAALGTAVGNPLTFPVIWASTYELGRYLLHDGATGDAPRGIGKALEHMEFAAIWEPLLKPMLVGGVPLGLAAAALSYGVLYGTVMSFQKQRARKRRMRLEQFSNEHGRVGSS